MKFIIYEVWKWKPTASRNIWHYDNIILMSKRCWYIVLTWRWCYYEVICLPGRNMWWVSRPHFYQTRSAWSMDQGSNENHSPVNNFAPTVTKFCVLCEGQALPHDTKFGNCRDKIVDSRMFLRLSLIHGSSWSGLIKLGPGGNWNSILWHDGGCFISVQKMRISLFTAATSLLTHTRPRDMARSRPPFWIFSFAAWKWVNMDGNWRNFDGNISSYV